MCVVNILVLIKTGGILRSFGHDQCGETLIDPWMVHVCGHYVHCKIGNFDSSIIFNVLVKTREKICLTDF